MIKKVLSVLLVLMLAFSLTTAATQAAEADLTMTITADKAQAQPGETITYTVTLSAVERLNWFETDLAIPEGLTFVKGSGAEVEGAAATMGFAAIDVVDTLFMNGYAKKTDYIGTEPIAIATFQCTVDADATGALTVGLDNAAAGIGAPTFDELSVEVVCNDEVTIAAAQTRILGDADGDGDVTTVDAAWIARLSAMMDIPESFDEIAADVDGDGNVTVIDQTFIERYLAFMDTPFPIGEVIA